MEDSLNPHWQGLWKKEKCSSLAPPRCILLHLMSLAGCEINPINVNFHLRNVLEIFDKHSTDKIWSKKDKEWKASSLMPIRVE